MTMKPKFVQAIAAFIGAAMLLAIAGAILWGLIPVGGLRREALAFGFAFMAAIDVGAALFFLARR
jgi:hypothetical protein